MSNIDEFDDLDEQNDNLQQIIDENEELYDKLYDLTDKIIYDSLIKPKIKEEIEKYEKIEKELKDNGSCVVIEYKKNTTNLLLRGTRSQCLNYWLKLILNPKNKKRKLSVNLIKSINIKDNTFIFGDMIIEQG